MTTSALTLRPPTVDDVPALAAFYRETQALYQLGGPSRDEEIHHSFESGLVDPEHNARIALSDGQIVAVADIWDQTKRGERLFVSLRAHPRERGVYALLLDWGGRRAAELARTRPAVVRAWTGSDDEPLADELVSRGFRLIRHFFRMHIELDEDVSPPDWPDGISLRTYRDGEARPVYDAVNDAFADHWDFVPVAYEDWLKFGPQSPTFDPALQFLAVEGDEIAGFALCDAERRRDTGHVGILGVRPRWRRRGLALALLRHAFREFQRLGRPKADLGVDAENPTGAVRLYERAGMRPIHRMDTYEQVLA